MKQATKDVVKLKNGITLIDQTNLDEISKHIAEVHAVLKNHYEELPKEVQKQLNPYLWGEK